MTEFDRLVAHLKNLQSKRIKQVTFDVNWLAEVLGVAPVPAPKAAPNTVTDRPLNVDGGSFVNSDDH